MQVRIDNWKQVQQRLREVEIERVERGSKEELQVIIAKDGERFEFSEDVFEKFKAAGLLKLGIRVRQ